MLYLFNNINNNIIYSILFEKKIMRQPGIEPGPTAWKAAILTFRLLSQLTISLFIKINKLFFIILNI